MVLNFVARLHDLVARTRTNKLVTDLVNLDRVRSLLKTISHRRRFLAHMERKRRSRFSMQGKRVEFMFLNIANIGAVDIPSIIVDPMPGTPPMSTRDIASLADGSVSVPSTPTPQQRFYPPDISLASDMSPGKGLQRSSRRISDISMLGTSDFGFKFAYVFLRDSSRRIHTDSQSRRTSMSDDDTDGSSVFSSSAMQNSMWGGTCFSVDPCLYDY